MILALDTSGDELIVDVMENGELVASATRIGGRHQGSLIEVVEEVLASGGGIKALEGFAVAVGPGSYTGLRVGLSTISGMAFARRLPIFPLSSLAVAAHRAATDDAVTALVDAGRGRVHAQAFVVSANVRVPGGRRTLQSLEDLNATSGPTPVIAEPVLMGSVEAIGMTIAQQVRPGPEALHAAARHAVGAGHALGYDQLAGDYGNAP